MSNERTIPSAAPKSVATFTLLSNGNQVSRSYQVLSIVVTKEINRIPTAMVLLLDGEASRQTFNVSNQPDFEPGAELEIQAGYRGSEESIFKGIVIRHSIKVRKGSSVLVIEAKDKAIKMTTQVKSAYFKETTDSDVLEQLLQTHGLDNDIESTSVQHPEIVQYRSTDWDFMLCRADVNGLMCAVSDGKVTIAKPDLGQSSTLTIQYGATVKDLDAEIDARLQFSGVKATAWNPADQSLVDGVEADEPTVPAAGNIDASTLAQITGPDPFQLSHSGRIQEPELKAWADAHLLKQRLAKIRGKVRVDGTAAVKPGQIITLNGVGDRFAGDLYVSGVRQEVQKGTWDTIFQFGLDPDWFAERFDVDDAPAGSMLPAVNGLQIGVVTRLEGDPDGEERIMVRVPVIHASDEGTWCRISTLDAGSDRGTVFRPEIGDEVIVGFINDDPRNAVVLGMCHSSAKAAPIPASDDNNEKGYVSRSKLKLHFDDDKKTILIETPGGNRMLFSDDEQKIKLEDQNGNSITLDQDGIKIESAKDFGIKAASDFSTESVNASLKGSAQLSLEGSGSAEVKSSGSTSVRGSIVQIN
ncbi:MAG TPA: type VI secretion system tip protein VgrG [Verrucomicrobiae bacterium]|nr:type VI secretion system tip protein VgrG [Verrucomicrobiae bacterium]